ncbi:hypothetical protein DRQ07_08285 [candidate division KSB1 bacterium]|nr:MAG: hypothetical protein DRQ07_08285 [candidate division KSB1 bacterium]
MKILIAEDDSISNRLLQKSLEKWNHEVISVKNGTDAWRVISSQDSPQMAVLDWMMPGMDGVTLCKKIRKETEGQKTKYIILLTAKGNKDDIVKGFEAGADDYITKPFNAQELKARVEAGCRIITLQNKLSEHIEKLKELDHLKSEFLATVSHELRTPLAVTREAVSLCVDGVAGDLTDMQNEFLTDALSNIDRLSRLIDDLLDTSKIEAGQVVVQKTDINICTLAQKAVKGFARIAKDKRIELTISTPHTPIIISADEGRIEQVFSNLLSNAINHTNEGGEISVTVRDNGEYVLCSVKDTGVGIDKENIPKLFNKFQQFGRKNGPGYRGTGLGLAIVKGLVEKHNGSVWAESEKGKGSVFYFTLQKKHKRNVLLLSAG